MRSSASGCNAGNVASNERAESECRERFMVLFNQQYAHYFEFLGGRTSSKGRVNLRCKVCGNEFSKAGSFAQQGTNIFCPRCHVHRDDAITLPIDGHLVEHLTELYESGMKVSDIEDATGLQGRHIRRMLKDNGIEFDTNRYRKHQAAERKAKRKAERKVVAESFSEIQQEIDSYRADKVLRSATNRAARDCKCFERTDEFIRRYAPTFATCGHCDTEYLFFPSWQRYGRKKAGPYCSKRCQLKHNRNSSNVGHRLRKYGSADKPRDYIHLSDVIERDNGTCYICGCKTSRQDYYLSHGWFTVGNTYPTIDHVIPLARGGTHTWDNVRLACRLCNSTKGDSLPIGE